MSIPQVKQPVATVGLIVNNGNKEAARLAQQISIWLKDRQIASWVRLPLQEDASSKISFAESLYPKPADLLLVFGGDGSIITVARNLLVHQVPLAGINFGRVGFLTELTKDNWCEALTKALQEGVTIKRHMTLEYELIRDKKIVKTGHAINDIVLSRGKLARLMPVAIKINNQPFASLRSDGLIISTPIGSTGYARSAGGAVLTPELSAYTVTAICPFLCVFPPMVFEASTLLSVTTPSTPIEMFLTIDGQELVELVAGETLSISGHPTFFPMASFEIKTYAERLKKAGFIQEASNG